MALSKILENSITDGVISAAKLKDFAAAVDLNGVELILDADQDTSITADTDDQIDIKISGADDFRFTANTFTALAGSGIVVPDGGLTFGSTAISATAAEINLIDGGASTGTTAVADADGIITNDGGTMRLTTAATFKTYFQEGISTAYDDLTTGDAAVNIATSAGNITIDAQGNDTDIIFKGTDGGADKTFMTIDGSAGGDLFLTGGLIDLKNDGSAVSQIKFYCESSNAHAQTLIGAPHSESATNTLTLPSTGGNSYLVTAASTATLTNKTLTAPVIDTITRTGVFTIDASGDIVLDSDGGDIEFKDGGTTIATHSNSSSNYVITTGVQDKDFIIKGDDGGAAITALTLDMSDAGAATFNDKITVGDGKLVLNSTAVTSTAAELNLLDGVSGLVQADLTKLAAVDSTATELNIIDGNATVGTTAVADGDGIVTNDGGTMRQTTVQTFATYFGSEITAMSNLVTTGALDSGSITSGFGNIDNGASNITNGGLVKLDVDADADDVTGDSATGRLTLGAGEDLNLYHGGTNSYIVNDTGDLIIDSAGDIVLDAAANDVKIKADGTTILTLSNSSSDAVITSGVQDKDIIFKGDDGGSAITALTLDMSAAGAAHFTGQVGIGVAPSAGTSMLTLAAAGNGSVQAGIDFDDTNSGDGYRVYVNAGNFYIRNYDDGQTDVQVTAGGDTTIARGDLIFGTAGKGVVLGATSNTAANTLDDYEEGTYAAVVTGATSGTFTMATENVLAYTKIGRLISIQGTIGVQSGSVSGNLRLSLPVAPTELADDAEIGRPSLFLSNTGNTNAGQTFLQLSPDGSAYFVKLSDAGSSAAITDSDVDSTFEVGVSFSYIGG